MTTVYMEIIFITTDLDTVEIKTLKYNEETLNMTIAKYIFRINYAEYHAFIRNEAKNGILRQGWARTEPT